MLGKLLLNKPTKLWDLYLDQAVFACRVRTHTTTKTSPFYLSMVDSLIFSAILMKPFQSIYQQLTTKNVSKSYNQLDRMPQSRRTNEHSKTKKSEMISLLLIN